MEGINITELSTMTASHLIDLHNIHYSYSGSPAILDNIHFHMGDERIGLIGANGSGKTTLLQIIVGLLTPEKGQICFKGKEITGEKGYRDLRKQVGFLFQNSDDQLFSPTVLEDVAFGPLNMGLSAQEARQISVRTLERLGLSGFENRITHMLSGGEKKLVALASILAMRPRLLLLDEPTNDLDPETRARLINILHSLKKPSIIISHDWDFLDQTTDILYNLENGRLSRCEEGHIHTHRHIHPLGDQPHHHHDE